VTPSTLVSFIAFLLLWSSPLFSKQPIVLTCTSAVKGAKPQLSFNLPERQIRSSLHVSLGEMHLFALWLFRAAFG
jgi:hypothetical protein